MTISIAGVDYRIEKSRVRLVPRLSGKNERTLSGAVVEPGSRYLYAEGEVVIADASEGLLRALRTRSTATFSFTASEYIFGGTPRAYSYGFRSIEKDTDNIHYTISLDIEGVGDAVTAGGVLGGGSPITNIDDLPELRAALAAEKASRTHTLHKVLGVDPTNYASVAVYRTLTTGRTGAWALTIAGAPAVYDHIERRAIVGADSDAPAGTGTEVFSDATGLRYRWSGSGWETEKTLRRLNVPSGENDAGAGFRYQAAAPFRNGEGNYDLDLVRENGEWYADRTVLNSPPLVDATGQQNEQFYFLSVRAVPNVSSSLAGRSAFSQLVYAGYHENNNDGTPQAWMRFQKNDATFSPWVRIDSEPAAAAPLTFAQLLAEYDDTPHPEIHTRQGVDGQRIIYTRQGVTRYRFVPFEITNTDIPEDAFYSDNDLNNLIVRRNGARI